MAASLALVAGGGVKAGGAFAPPTFNADVAPIVLKKCVSCHRPHQAAPMSLLTYEDARPWAQSIRKKVASREMPPWRADPRFGHFRNDPSLSQDEIKTIVAWVDGGAPKGTEPLPAAPQFAEGWNHPSGRPPDIVLEMPIAFDIPAHGQVPPFAVYSELPPQLAGDDHFVEAIQLLPRNIPIVHHSAFSMRALPAGVRLGSGPAWPGGPVLSNLAVLVDRSPAGLAMRRGASAAEVFSTVGTSHFAFFFPGNNGFVEFASNTGKRIRHEDYVEWSVHYTPSGRPETDSEHAGLWLQRVPPTHEVLTLRIGDFHIVNGQEVVLPADVHTTPGHAAVVSVLGRCDGVPCEEDKSMIPTIPPRARNWKITAITPFQDDVTLYLAYPHGHFRLMDMTYVVTYPDGREETILSVPRFDFNWQLVYEWAEPIRIAAGSTIKAIGHYDNSANNRLNPSADSEVYWSEQSWDEMFNGYVDLSIDKMDVRLETKRRADRTDLATSQVPIVTVVGCVSRRADGVEMLTKASTPQISAIVHADAGEIAAARNTPLGTNQYRLIGTAEFSSERELLSQGQRAQFTRESTANVTNGLKDGHRLFVKALAIPGVETRLNVLSAQTLAGNCR
jgi:predicted CXXCH cytochrome family protein